MKTCLSRLALIMTAAPACALAQIYTAGGTINLQASLTETYDSQILGRADSGGSYSTTLSPSLHYVRDESILRTNAELAVGIERHFDDSTFNQETYSASTGVALERGTLGNYGLSLNLSYTRGASANYDIGARLQSESYGLSGAFDFSTGERSGLSFSTALSRNISGSFGTQNSYRNSAEFHFGPFFKETSFYTSLSSTITKSSGKNDLNSGLNQNSTVWSLGLDRKLTEKLTLRLGTGYSWYNNPNAASTYTTGNKGAMVFNASLTGPFLPERYFPKTESSFSIAYSENPSRGLYDNGSKSLTGGLNLTWNARENTKLSFSASKGMRLTVNDYTADTSTVEFSISEKMTSGVQLSGSVGYTWNTYSGTTSSSQSGATASTAASYAFGKRRNWSGALSYRFTQSSSAVAFRDFNRHTASATLSYSY